MKRKVFIVLFVLMTIGAWINLLFSASQYQLIAQPYTWDAIKMLIDLLLAVGWTILTVLWVRRK